ncbi:Sap-like sulfolipid-1-addressing protein [Branchiibius hedensis]|uniref:Sap, sulfolipid-1-addressing protein n=1 Tax=Branchiibius hedensis TaxID=672460 RepID=A0A2Y9C172_9MICO|nr:GAP family protein [Branchiibius hedensis]PWJ25038.1 Sap-like sulfolipid-1-addressing protein [Branchiibius hedensis]SSA33853.1 Sap, sulfolipid-1-addressing protein [Branchiibius hedensis]
MSSPSLTQLIPLAASLIISPLPIIAVVAMALGTRGRSAAIVFTAVYTAIGIAVTAGTAFSTHAAVRATGAKDSTVSVVASAVIGLAFLALAILNWRQRPKPPGSAAKTPGWLAKTETISIGGAATLGLAMGLTQSKNFPALIKAGTIIAADNHNPVFILLMSTLFATVGSLAMILLTLAAASGSPTTRERMEGLKTDLIAHNAFIMATLFGILAASELAHTIQALLH